MVFRFTIATIALTVAAHVSAQEPWATYRGNNQRTGHTDGMPGPAKPNVLWALQAKDHFIASPMVAEKRLVISGLGAFNLAQFSCLTTDPKAAKRELWNKTAPYLKLPTVSSPAVFKGRLVFGDGMHQTDGAILHCLDFATGLPIWQLPVPGRLVHLEGSPSISDGRVIIGGGAAGVLCVDLDKVTFEGKEMELPAVQKAIAARWQTMVEKYKMEKAKDPDFAIPPDESQLPRAQPKLLWQQGAEKWHVDAAVAVVGDKVLVGSAFLDKEQVGDRAMICLDAKDGKVLWRTPLKWNPWGGATVQGNIVIVAGSNINYDTTAIGKKNKGQVVALDLADGKEKWSKELTGGVVACAAIADGAAVVTATDAKVRAFELETGERRWIYESKAACFAPPAIAGQTVYAGDLNGVVHAIDLKTGNGQWTLDLAKAPGIGAGMIYGGPAVSEGRVYVATCNLEGANARQPTAIVCIGEK